jgi:hypothetical protein
MENEFADAMFKLSLLGQNQNEVVEGEFILL